MIKEALRFHRIPMYLQRVVGDYLADRAVRYPTAGGAWKERRMSCGVPQGLVLGPLLWNIGYDWVLRGQMLPGVRLFCYADDTLVTARASKKFDWRNPRPFASTGLGWRPQWAPVWAERLTAVSLPLLRGAQRIMAVRLVRGYRTISGEAACALAGSPPWDLEAKVLAQAYHRRVEARSSGRDSAVVEVDWRREAQEELLRQWRRRLESPSAGGWTISAIQPILQGWVARRHGVLTFRLTQMLSGHGCFGRYLWRVAGREASGECHECGADSDTALHTLADCPAWAVQRTELVAQVGRDLYLEEEAAERIREVESRDPIRRRRAGRRRFVQDHRMPP